MRTSEEQCATNISSAPCECADKLKSKYAWGHKRGLLSSSSNSSSGSSSSGSGSSRSRRSSSRSGSRRRGRSKRQGVRVVVVVVVVVVRGAAVVVVVVVAVVAAVVVKRHERFKHARGFISMALSCSVHIRAWLIEEIECCLSEQRPGYRLGGGPG